MGTEPSENLKMRFSTSRKYIKLPFRQHSWIQAPSLCRCLSHPTCALCLAQGRQGRCCRCGRGGWHACAQVVDLKLFAFGFLFVNGQI